MSAMQSVTAIRQNIEESLSAIRNPADATAVTHEAAVAKLEKYEAVLGISADPSDFLESD